MSEGSEPVDSLSGPAGDRIGALIRLAGRRPPVDAAAASRVKAAVRAHWRREVRRRSRRRIIRWSLAAAAVVIAAAGVLFRSGLLSPGPAPIATVEAVLQPAWARIGGADRAAAPGPAAIGTVLPAGSDLDTGEDGRLALRLVSGVSVRLDVGSRIRLLSASAVFLERGTVYVDTGPGGRVSSSVVEIRTPAGVIRDFGTQFEVRRSGDSLRIRVREGRIRLERDRDSWDAGAGTELEVGPGGPPVRRDVPVWGPEWDWLAAVTPPVRLDGLSLAGYLDWYTRERGWRLEYGSDRIAAAAAATMLSGSTRGLSLDESLEAVLVTSRLASRRVDGVLIIQGGEPRGD